MKSLHLKDYRVMKRQKVNLREYLREKEMAEVAKMSLKERLYLAMELSEFCLALRENLAKKRI